VTSLRLSPALALAAVLMPTLGAGTAQAGLSGLTVLTSDGHLANALAQSRASVECPKGKVPLGGGAFINTSNLGIGIASSFPSDRFWIVDVSNPTATAATFTIRVVCAKKPRQYSLSAGLFTPLRSGATVSAFAACPAGSQPLGGGADTSASIPLVNMTASLPTGQAWQATEFNGTAVDAAVASFTTCGSLKGYTAVDGGALSISHGETRLTAGCPRNTIAVGGGASGTPATAVLINSSAPNNAFSDPTRPFDLWDTEINNVSNAPATVRAWAVCVRP
jgi:hypothetical protein